MQAGSAEELIKVGEITGAFGIKGWCICQSLTEPRDLLFSCSPWKLLKNGQVSRSVTPSNHRPHKKHFVVELAELQDRTQALIWQHSEIFIRKSQLPKLQDNEYYLQDIIGFTVINNHQLTLGTVSHFLATGAHEVMVVKTNQQELLIPFVRNNIIKTIDYKQQQIIVDWEPEYR